MLRTSLLFSLLFLLVFRVSAQKDDPTLSLGYFAPYGVQFGAKGTASFHLKDWHHKTSNDSTKTQQLNISPGIGYFVFPSVQRNYLLNVETIYQLRNSTKRFTPMASIGIGYLLSRQKLGGSVNLATGDITYDVETLHHFLPTLNIGFNIVPRKTIGYYLKGFFGRKFTADRANSSFFGLETGLTWYLKRKN